MHLPNLNAVPRKHVRRYQVIQIFRVQQNVTKGCTVNRIQAPVNGRKRQGFHVLLMKTACLSTALTRYVRHLSVLQFKMPSRSRIFLILILCSVSVSCSGMKHDRSGTKITKESNNAENVSEAKEQETIADKIIIRDIFNGQTYPLKKISMNYPVFIEVSASWCSACKEMEKTTEKLYEYFKGKIFFIRIFMAGDGSLDETGIIPSMEIVSSPEEMKIELSEALPRVLILNRDGSEVTADLTGTYPMLYYYGILSEL